MRPRERTGDARPFGGVLREELRLILRRRAQAAAAAAPNDSASRDSAADPTEATPQQVSAFGVAFSGGGIRSATFNLGVLQGLAEAGLLPRIDYLSTVSGGGYIGGWLHGLIRRLGGHPKDAQARLVASIDRAPGPPDVDPITFLRKYSNYLAPSPGLFSADSWVIGVIWMRNVLLNQLILIPAIACTAALAFLAVLVRQVPFGDPGRTQFNPVAAAVGAVSLLLAVLVLARNLSPIARQSISSERTRPHALERCAERRAGLAVAAVFVTAGALAFGDFDPRSPVVIVLAGLFIIGLIVAIQWQGGFIGCFKARHPATNREHPGFARVLLATRALLHVLWMSTLSGLVTTALVWAIWRLIEDWSPAAVLAFALPLVALAIIAGVMLLVGLMGADYPDAAREWTARTGSRLAIAIALWAGLFSLTVYGPWVMAWLLGHLQATGMSAIAAWIATTMGGVAAGRSGRTAGGGGTGVTKALELLVNVAPTVFLVGYIIAISAGVHVAVARVAPAAPVVHQQAPAAAGGDVPDMPSAAAYADRYFDVLTVNYDAEGWMRPRSAFALLAIFSAVALVISSRINVNEFSLHHFYKNRLVRCYLGASHSVDGTRVPNPATGFDPLDDFPLSLLTPEARSAATGRETPYLGPYPIVNATLNLNTGSELAQQERKAASFVFTPAFCGFDPPSSRESARAAAPSGMDAYGYRPTRGYSQLAGPDLGTTVAISGAAANPNEGYHTSGPMAFLMTVFNARLGWWLGNPRWGEASTHAGPKFALRYLLAELLGQTSGRSKFVNLSDGGHFDNLGLYELVRRRCRFIIVCDSEEDGQLTFGSLGGAIRKCRADFGVEIDIDPAPIRRTDGLSSTHCVVGRIHYPEPESAFVADMTEGLEGVGAGKQEPSQAWLLYLKSSLTGDEPADVLEYHSRFEEFPHQSTADQFFSESQFESYRRLGCHVFRAAFEDVRVPGKEEAERAEQTERPCDEGLLARYPLVRTFQDLTRKWYAKIPVSAEAASRLADSYVEIIERLASLAPVKDLYQELLKPGESTSFREVGAPIHSELIAAGIEIMQLLENVYTEFGLESAFNAHNPRNAGWMNMFRNWVRSDILYNDIWPRIRGNYHPMFQLFVDRLREKTHVEPKRL